MRQPQTLVGAFATSGARAWLAVILTLLALAAYASLRDTKTLAAIEGLTLDLRFALRGTIEPGGDVIILAIDDPAIEALGGWPLPREALARTARALCGAGVGVVVFDILLLDPVAAPPQAPGRAELADALADCEHALIPYAFTFTPDARAVERVPPQVERSSFSLVRTRDGAPGAPTLRPHSLLHPPPDLLDAADTGHATVLLDPSGALRFDHAALAYNTQFYPSLSLVAAMHAQGLDRTGLVLDSGRGIHLGDRFIPTDRRMRIAVNHYGPAGTLPRRSLRELLEGSLPKELLAGNVVIVGATATGVGDAFNTPFSALQPGVEFFATVVDNLLSGRWHRQDEMVTAVDLAVIAGAGAGAAAVACASSATLVAVAYAALAAGVFALTYAAFAAAGLWLNLVFPALLLTASATLSLAALALARASGGDGPPDREDRTQYVSILFVDLAGFTGVSEHMAPAQAHGMLRSFQAVVERAVEAHGGLVDKFMGDGALIVFGMRESAPHDAADALACARTLVGRLADWHPDAQMQTPLDVGIGVHHGLVTVGRPGGRHRAPATVSGDAVNVCSRLQDLTRELGTTILASDAAIEAARGYGGEAAVAGFRRLPMQTIRGRARPLGVWGWPAEGEVSEDRPSASAP